MYYRHKAGDKYYRLTAIRHISGGKWLVRCDCGNEKVLQFAQVKNGHTKSCGCLHLERCGAGLNRLSHGDAKKGKVTRLHTTWRSMLRRCSENGEYAMRGITVCHEWMDYSTFKHWATTHGYKDTLTIDRIDNSAGYSPTNCRWVGAKEQARNRSTSRFVEYEGRTMTLAELSEITGVKYSTLRDRIVVAGWDVSSAVTTPVKRNA